MFLTKQMMKPGSYNKGQNQFAVSANDLKEMHTGISDLKQAGYKVPVWMEHPSTSDRLAYPVKADSDLVKKYENDIWFAGWLEDGKINDDGMMDLILDTPDELGKKLVHTGTFVSPQFGEWTDDDGKAWSNLVHHVALTRNPVNKSQTNSFQEVSSENLEAGLDHPNFPVQNRTQLIRMSLAEAYSSGSKVIRFSLGDADVPQPAMQGQQGQPGQAPQAGADPQGDALKTKLTEALQAMGITLSPDSPILIDVESMSRVLSMVVSMTADAAEKAKRNATSQGGSNPSGLSEQATVIAMSTTTEMTTGTTIAPVTPEVHNDPRVTQMSNTILAQQARIDKLSQQFTVQGRQAYSDRIGKCVKQGQMPKARADELLSVANVFQFSDTAGDSKSELDIELVVCERLPIGACLNDNERIKQFSITETAVNQMSGFYAGDAEPDAARIDSLMAEYGMGALPKIL